MFFFEGTVETLPLKVWVISEYLIFLGIDSAITIYMTPLLASVTGRLHIMQGHLIFLVGGGLRFFPNKIAPAMRSRVFCSFI